MLPEISTLHNIPYKMPTDSTSLLLFVFQMDGQSKQSMDKNRSVIGTG